MFQLRFHQFLGDPVALREIELRARGHFIAPILIGSLGQ
jgi:hypothetical protein